ncbi:acetate--CoA ligase family protein [Streptomyces sp. NPDC046805]|uniref:acetate--CoA ligase family protein n=1 Tax=Streptomyces sp. NPDC046805 TaxID=3155134 RepID=UPI0033C2578C
MVFGLGGVYTEALSDIAMVPVDAGREEIRAAVAGTKLGAVLRSPRRKSQHAFDAFVDVVVKLAAFAWSAGPRLEAVDINPLIVRGDEVTGVDALVVAG